MIFPPPLRTSVHSVEDNLNLYVRPSLRACGDTGQNIENNYHKAGNRGGTL